MAMPCWKIRCWWRYPANHVVLDTVEVDGIKVKLISAIARDPSNGKTRWRVRRLDTLEVIEVNL